MRRALTKKPWIPAAACASADRTVSSCLKENLNVEESRNSEQREPLGKEKTEASGIDKVKVVGVSSRVSNAQ